MKRIILIISIFIMLNSFIYAAFEYIPGNIKTKSMRYNTTSLIMGIDNSIINPASIMGTEKWEINISYENLYVFSHAFALSGAYSTDYGTVGARFSEFFVLGDYANFDSIISTNTRLQTERVLQIVYGATLYPDILQFGSNVNIMYLEQLNNSSNIYYTFDFGFIGTVYNRWNIGISVKNLTNTYIGGNLSRYYIDRIVNAGISFNAYDNLNTTFNISKATGWPTSFGGGIVYELIENLFIIRAGARSYPIEYGAGFEIIVKNMSIDYGYSATQNLNAIHMIQVNYTF